MKFTTIEEMIAASAASVRPAERLTVPEAAERYRYLNNPGSYVGMWRNKTTPYLVEPMEELTSLDFTGMIFVGPARTGKSDMFFNWLTSTATQIAYATQHRRTSRAPGTSAPTHQAIIAAQSASPSTSRAAGPSTPPCRCTSSPTAIVARAAAM